MKLKRIIVGTVLVIALSFSGYAIFANQAEEPSNNYLNQPYETELAEAAPLSYFTSFTGIVRGISEFEDMRGNNLTVSVENADGQIANLIVTEGTFFINDREITVGAEVTGYFETNAPALMIYPPQFNVRIVSVDIQDEESITNIKVDRFDENLVSQDQTLSLNIADDTAIITQGGQDFEGGELQNRKLIVFYDVSTRSIPAITTPSKIIVMYEIAVHPIAILGDDYVPEDLGGLDANIDDLYNVDPIDISAWDIIVDGQQIYARGFTSEEGAAMVPLRVIAEALGFELTWEWSAAERVIMLDGEITLRIGDTTYFNQDTALELPFAPMLFENTTYVPLQFFRIVAGMNNAYASGGQVVINNDEYVME